MNTIHPYTPWQAYFLRDPRTKEVRYVGVTADRLKQRFSNHLSYARNGKQGKLYEWLRELLTLGLVPFLEPYERGIGFNSWKRTERFYISTCRAIGDNLLNESTGGGGRSGIQESEKLKTKKSLSRLGKNRGKYTKVIFLATKDGRVKSEEQKFLISNSLKRYYSYKKSISFGVKLRGVKLK